MAQFEEIGRIKVNETRDIVMSKVSEDGQVKGVNINSYITTQKYTGFTKDGVFVPEDRIEEFGEMVKRVLACS